MYKNLLIALLSALSVGCDKEIKIDMPQHESKAVVNCFFTPDSIFKVDIKKSVPIFNNYSEPIKNAEVKLYQDGFFIEELEYKESEYYSIHKAETATTYSIKAEFPELDNIEATSTTPTFPNLIESEYVGAVEDTGEDLIMERVKLVLQDNVTTEDYYEIVLEMTYDTGEMCGNQHVIAQADIDGMSDPVFINEAEPKNVFTDELFNGEIHNFDFRFYRNNCVLEDYSLTLILRSITKEYYDYKKALARHQYTQESDIWNGFAEPVQMISNIEGGLGIFTGYTEVKQQIK